MKTLIVYGTTYGHAKACAEQLKGLLTTEAAVMDAVQAQSLSLAEYDQVIVGGSIYMGKVQKSVRDFCTQHQQALLDKKLGLFLCCGLPKEWEKNAAAAFPEDLRKHAAAVENFGGRADLSKMGFIHRTLTQMMAKSTAGDNNGGMLEQPENIRRMAEIMNQ